MRRPAKMIRKVLFIDLVTIIISAFLGVICLLVVYLLPTEEMARHVRSSMGLLVAEGDWFQWTKLMSSQKDNYTDAIMLNEAIYNGEEPILDKALAVYRLALPEGNSRIQDLSAVINNSDHLVRKEYPRFWHGYLVVLKPLLFLMRYQDIQILNWMVETILVVLLIYSFYKKHHLELTIPYLLSYGLSMPLTNAFCIEYTVGFYVHILAMILILFFGDQIQDKLQNAGWLFLLFGIVICYFDYLVYSFVSLGMPLTLYLYFDKSPISEIKNKLSKIAFLVMQWWIGYLGMWGMKWLISSVILKENVLESGFSQIALRMSFEVSDEKINLFQVLKLNIENYYKTPLVLLLIVYVTVLVVKIYKMHSYSAEDFIVFGIICALPFMWYLIAPNHSYIHAFFSYKELMITTFAALALLNKWKSKITIEKTEIG